MVNNDVFKMAAKRARKRLEEQLPGTNFNAKALETMFRENGVDFTFGYLEQITESVDLMADYVHMTSNPGQ